MAAGLLNVKSLWCSNRLVRAMLLEIEIVKAVNGILYNEVGGDERNAINQSEGADNVAVVDTGDRDSKEIGQHQSLFIQTVFHSNACDIIGVIVLEFVM
ncbi:hypothetical protein CVT26_004126 [Gymnopilus dilepis]|uniref:Uncharacterized protein n=1 Tax=Gymnopilus dilepis TaxID=231916 RepID=A0A409WTX0_9AGAR|nr:hypothetical protein CVT26_004126 [Gymnopilus dilepis]